MKHLYLIGGTMGIGKTTTCQLLKKNLNNAVFLDGDWCWDADPFYVTDETKAMVTDNICHLLNNYLHCSAYDNIIFCWVMHEQSIIDDILSKLDVNGHRIKVISLICNENALKERLKKDIGSGIRDADVLTRSIQRLPLYQCLKTIKIDVSTLNAAQVADRIAKL